MERNEKRVLLWLVLTENGFSYLVANACLVCLSEHNSNGEGGAMKRLAAGKDARWRCLQCHIPRLCAAKVKSKTPRCSTQRNKCSLLVVASLTKDECDVSDSLPWKREKKKCFSVSVGWIRSPGWYARLATTSPLFAAARALILSAYHRWGCQKALIWAANSKLTIFPFRPGNLWQVTIRLIACFMGCFPKQK